MDPHSPLVIYKVHLAIALYLVIAIEAVVRFLRFRKALSTSTVVANCTILGIELFLRSLTFGFRLAAAIWLSSLVNIHWAWTWSSTLVLYVLVDFIYYWRHRLLHNTQLGWAVHSTHHSSEEMTVLATFRLSWLEAGVRDFFYMPLLFFGFDPLHLLFIVEINAASQFWCHTDTIGPLKWLDPWLNTPMNHGIHHSKIRTTAECNYGSTLMIWDKLFGTYQPGQANLEYGIEGIRESKNPFVLELGLFWKLVRSKVKNTP